MRMPRNASRLGALRHRVAIEEPLRTADEGGGAAIAWNLVATVWAEVAPKTGREVFESDQLGGRITHDVRLRYRHGRQPEDALCAPGADLRHSSRCKPGRAARVADLRLRGTD